MKDRNENRPGYKKTKVGWIPEEWKCKKLRKTVSKPLTNGLFKRPNEYGSGTLLVNVTDTYREITINPNTLGRVRASSTEIERYENRHGDLFFVRSSLKLEGVGNCCVLLFDQPQSVFECHLIRVRLDQQEIDPLFMAYLCRSLAIRKQMLAFAQTTTMTTLPQNCLEQCLLPTPNITEQKKVAKILSAWDEAIDQTRKLIDAKMSLKKALMQVLLTGKMRLPEFKEKWKTYRLNELLKQISRRVEFDDHAIYDLISVRRRSGGVFSRGKIPGHTIRTKQMYLAKRNDFLISKMQIVHGASGLLTKEFDSMHISGSYIALRVRDSQELDVYFLNWISKTPYFYHLTYLSSYGVHIEKMTFNLRLFLKSKISIPIDIKEQRRIAEVLSTANEEIETLEKKLVALEKQKRGLMQKLLTGEVRVKS